MNAIATNPVLDHFLTTFRVQIADMENRIDAERENLSDWRKNEATDLVLTDEEKDRLPALRIFAAAPDLLVALKSIHEYVRLNDSAYRNGFSGTDELYSLVDAAIGKAEGRG